MMLLRLSLFIAFTLYLIVPDALLAREGADGAVVRARIVTSAGSIIVALDAKRAPQTTANFMAYVDDGRFDGTNFYRAARSKASSGNGFVQGGIGTDARRMLHPVVHEPTTKTGLRHVDAVISMARSDRVDSARGNFFITIGPVLQMDARGSYAGYAAFGRVVSGMDVVRRMLAMPTGGGRGAMRGQMILKPVTILRVERLSGIARPTGRPKPWLLGTSVPKRDR